MAEIKVFREGQDFRIDPDTPELRRALEAAQGAPFSDAAKLALSRQGWSREGVTGLSYHEPNADSNTVPEGHVEHWFCFYGSSDDSVHLPEAVYLAVLAAYLLANGRSADAAQVQKAADALPR